MPHPENQEKPVSTDCLLVADDLTGACDAAVHFAVRGLRPATVLVARGAGAAGARVLAVSTESRDLPPAEILRAMAAAATEFPVESTARVFKKIDSTMRGNTGLEIAAALDSFRCDAAVVCPAFPGMHRVVEGGFLRVTSAPEFAPINVARRLQLQCGLACAYTRPDGIAAILAAGARFVSVDANCDLDLDRIASATAPMGRRILWVGSAGLAAALARLLGQKVRKNGLTGESACPTKVQARAHQRGTGAFACQRCDPNDIFSASQASAPQPALARSGAALFCMGSDHPVTLAQQDSLLAERPSVLLHPHAATRESVCQALARGKHVILRIPRGLVSVEQVRERITGVPAAALVLSGGDTASLVCRAAGAQRIELCGEIVSGVPHGILRGGEFDGVSVATKSGGFGRSDTLIHIADYFSCLNRT
jgi:D-threonate/D-erythronate kinase